MMKHGYVAAPSLLLPSLPPSFPPYLPSPALRSSICQTLFLWAFWLIPIPRICSRSTAAAAAALSPFFFSSQWRELCWAQRENNEGNCKPIRNWQYVVLTNNYFMFKDHRLCVCVCVCVRETEQCRTRRGEMRKWMDEMERGGGGGGGVLPFGQISLWGLCCPKAVEVTQTNPSIWDRSASGDL